MLRSLFKLAPTRVEPNLYLPSPLSLNFSLADKLNYTPANLRHRQLRKKKVLIICTRKNRMTMRNGKEFFTGNHPVETLVPMMHFMRAGFEIEIATIGGDSAALEMWAFPNNDTLLYATFLRYQEQFLSPLNLTTLRKSTPNLSSEYAAIFIPGGHGAMLELPYSAEIGKLLEQAHQDNVLIISICHGPAALLSLKTTSSEALYNGYKVCAFPDLYDKWSRLLGYLPGEMPWFIGKELSKIGISIVNRRADDSVMKDRGLITAAGPAAANRLGLLATEYLIANDSV